MSPEIIGDVVLESDQKQCEVSWDGEGPLRITEQVGERRRALPTNLEQKQLYHF